MFRYALGTPIEGMPGLTAEQVAWRSSHLAPGQTFMRSEVGGLAVTPDGTTVPLNAENVDLRNIPVPYPDRVVLFVDANGGFAGAVTTARGLILSYGNEAQRAASGVSKSLVDEARRAEGLPVEPDIPPAPVTASAAPSGFPSAVGRVAPSGPVNTNNVSGVTTPIVAYGGASQPVLMAGERAMAPTGFDASPVVVPTAKTATQSPAWTPPASLVVDNDTAAPKAAGAAPVIQKQKVPAWVWVVLGLLALGSVA